jgi:hypothetical protein
LVGGVVGVVVDGLVVAGAVVDGLVVAGGLVTGFVVEGAVVDGVVVDGLDVAGVVAGGGVVDGAEGAGVVVGGVVTTLPLQIFSKKFFSSSVNGQYPFLACTWICSKIALIELLAFLLTTIFPLLYVIGGCVSFALGASVTTWLDLSGFSAGVETSVCASVAFVFLNTWFHSPNKVFSTPLLKLSGWHAGDIAYIWAALLNKTSIKAKAIKRFFIFLNLHGLIVTEL